MPENLWGDQFWGDAQWGESDPVVLDDFTDTSGNGLALPAVINFLGFTPSDVTAVRNRIYDMHIESIRRIDESGGLFWKRFCEGFEAIRLQLEARIDELPSLWNIVRIEDRFVRLLLPQVGWTSDLSVITDKLSDDDVRRLVASAASLWARRGTAGAYIEILNTIIGVDAFEWHYFDRRFVLDASRLGHDRDPSQWTDAYFLDTASRQTTQLVISDAERSLDRELIRDTVKLWRPAGQRVRVTYTEFWDRFADDSKPWVTYTSQTPDVTVIEDGVLKLEDASDQHAFVETTALKSLSRYMTNARVKFDVLASYFGVVVGHVDDFTTCVEIRLYPATNELKIYRNAVELAGVDIKASSGVIFYPATWHTLRVFVDGQVFEIFLDNERIFEADGAGNLAPGTSGVTHGAGVTLQVDYFEILPIPGQVELIGVNS